MFLTSCDISVVILGGLSLRNIARTEKFEQYFQDKAKDVHRLYYLHRQHNNENIDMEHEVGETYKLLSAYGPEDRIVIVAKSIGCMIALHVLESHPELLDLSIRCVFMGFPATTLGSPTFAERFPTLEGYVLQNRNDPVARYADIVPVFMASKLQTIELPGSTHHYELQDVEHLELEVF